MLRIIFRVNCLVAFVYMERKSLAEICIHYSYLGLRKVIYGLILGNLPSVSVSGCFCRTFTLEASPLIQKRYIEYMRTDEFAIVFAIVARYIARSRLVGEME
jgi:hypothetical protein